MTTDIMNTSSFLSPAIDSQLTKLPTKIPYSLLVEIEEYRNQQRSPLTQIQTNIPLSLLVEIKQFQNLQQRGNKSEILDIVRGVLHVAAVNSDQCHQQGGNNCSFLSPMKKKSTLVVDDSKLFKLSLDEDSEEEDQDGEGQKADAVASNTATTSDTPKSVHFESQAWIEYTISREDMTQEEKQKYWLQDEEFALIRLRDGYLGTLVEQKQREMAAAAELHSSTTPFPTVPSSIAISPQHWICTRGLEYKMKLGFLRTRERRLSCLEEVLIEQERQWDEHWDNGRNSSPFHYDDEAISAVCSEISNECKIHAEAVASNDRREVEEIIRVEGDK